MISFVVLKYTNASLEKRVQPSEEHIVYDKHCFYKTKFKIYLSVVLKKKTSLKSQRSTTSTDTWL